MNALFSRWMPAATLFAWGATILALAPAGLLAREYQIYAFIAAGVLLAGAVVVVVAHMDAGCCAESACGHGLSRRKSGKILSFAVITLPIAFAPFASKTALDKLRTQNCESANDYGKVPAAAREQYQNQKKLAAQNAAAKGAPATSLEQIPNAVPPPADGTAAGRGPADLTLPTKDGSQPPPADTPAQPAGSQPPATESKVADYLTRTPDGTIVAEVLDLLYAAQDNLLRKDFEGQRVQLIGQFMPDSSNNAAGNRFKAVRMFMTCCAADARPVATLVEAEKLPAFPEMTWVKITGTPTFPLEKGRRISVLKAEKIEKAEPPAEAMIY